MKPMVNASPKAKKIFGAAGFATALFFLTAGIAAAQNGTVKLTDPLGGAGFQTVVNNVLSFIFYDIAMPLTVLMALVGAFQMMTAGGDPEKFSKGRKTLMYAAIGFLVAFAAGGLAKLIQNIL